MLKSILPSRSYYCGRSKAILNDYVRFIGCEAYVWENMLSQMVDSIEVVRHTTKTNAVNRCLVLILLDTYFTY